MSPVANSKKCQCPQIHVLSAIDNLGSYLSIKINQSWCSFQSFYCTNCGKTDLRPLPGPDTPVCLAIFRLGMMLVSARFRTIHCGSINQSINQIKINQSIKEPGRRFRSSPTPAIRFSPKPAICRRSIVDGGLHLNRRSGGPVL